ncbi:PAC2 family protein [uncultured archaeon]|nr:PAC2 family protein [uncultured archaeon]
MGTISASYLVEKLKMEFVGYVTSDQFPPLAAIHDYKPHFPARIYISKKHNLIVLLSEFIVPVGACYELAQKVHEFAKDNKVRQIISLGGIHLRSEEPKVYGIASQEKLLDALVKSEQVTLIKEGATTGVTGVLLAQGAVEGFPVVSFLAQAHEEYMDPKASAMVLDVLKTHLKLDFETRTLESEAAEIESKMKDMMARAKASHAQYKKSAETGTGDSLGPMYG